MTDTDTPTDVAQLPSRAERRRAARSAQTRKARTDEQLAPPEPETHTPPPLDPYATHEVRFGPSRVFNPKTKAFVTIAGVSCSCGRLSRPVPNTLTGEILAQLHGLEIGLARLGRHAGIDLEGPPSEFEKLGAGHGPTIAAFHARIAKLGELVEQAGGQLDADGCVVDLVDDRSAGRTEAGVADPDPED